MEHHWLTNTGSCSFGQDVSITTQTSKRARSVTTHAITTQFRIILTLVYIWNRKYKEIPLTIKTYFSIISMAKSPLHNVSEKKLRERRSVFLKIFGWIRKVLKMPLELNVLNTETSGFYKRSLKPSQKRLGKREYSTSICSIDRNSRTVGICGVCLTCSKTPYTKYHVTRDVWTHTNAGSPVDWWIVPSPTRAVVTAFRVGTSVSRSANVRAEQALVDICR